MQEKTYAAYLLEAIRFPFFRQYTSGAGLPSALQKKLTTPNSMTLALLGGMVICALPGKKKSK